MSKKIVIDITPMVMPKKTGVGIYTQRLFEALAKEIPDDTLLVGYYFNFLGRKKPVLPKSNNIVYRQIRLYPGFVVNYLRRIGVEFPVEFLAKTKPNIVLFPNFLSQPTICKSRKFVVLHDLSYLVFPEFASDKNRKDLERFIPKSLKRCTGVITVSEFSKRAIVETYKYPVDNILVTPIPPEDKLSITAKESRLITAKLNITRDYILFLGTLEPRKNLISLLQAYEINKDLHGSYDLVCTGGMVWKFEEIAKKIHELQSRGLNVIHTGYVTDEQKAALYQNASVFVLPSHYEGFGMPVLEAGQYNIPIALSDIPVFREVAKDSAVYFDQNNPSDIAIKIVELLGDTDKCRSLIDKSNKNLSRYKWPDVAKSVVHFFDL
jgi:glycosyltransferase involved in cell wall biosynthesis